MGTLHEDVFACVIISRWTVLKMRNFWDKFCRENENTHIRVNNVYRKSRPLWNYVEKYGVARQATHDDITRRMRFACWTTKATNTHSEYVTFIVFPRQQWFREWPSILRHTYIVSVMVMVWCVGSGLCNKLITRPEESCRVCVCV
jgi:hypothetical protein